MRKRSSGEIMQCGLRKAVHSSASACKLLHHFAALTGDWAWVAVEEVFVCHSLPQTMQTKKVCQTGRHLLHSDVAERKRMTVKPWRCMEH